MNQDTPLVLVSNRGPATFEGGEARRGGEPLAQRLFARVLDVEQPVGAPGVEVVDDAVPWIVSIL